MYRCTKCQLIWRTSDFGTKFSPKNMTDKTFEKNKHYGRNKHAVMYLSTKSQS